MGKTHGPGSCLTVGPLIGRTGRRGNMIRGRGRARSGCFLADAVIGAFVARITGLPVAAARRLQILASPVVEATLPGSAPFAIAAIDRLDGDASLMFRTFEAGAALRAGFGAEEPSGPRAASVRQAGGPGRADAAADTFRGRAYLGPAISFPDAFTGSGAGHSRRACQARGAFAGSGRRATGAAGDTFLERPARTPAPAIGAARRNAVTVPAASLRGRAAIELATADLARAAFGTPALGSRERARQNEQDRGKEESDQTMHECRHGRVQRRRRQGHFSFPCRQGS